MSPSKRKRSRSPSPSAPDSQQPDLIRSRPRRRRFQLTGPSSRATLSPALAPISTAPIVPAPVTVPTSMTTAPLGRGPVSSQQRSSVEDLFLPGALSPSLSGPRRFSSPSRPSLGSSPARRSSSLPPLPPRMRRHNFILGPPFVSTAAIQNPVAPVVTEAASPPFIPSSAHFSTPPPPPPPPPSASGGDVAPVGPSHAPPVADVKDEDFDKDVAAVQAATGDPGPPEARAYSDAGLLAARRLIERNTHLNALMIRLHEWWSGDNFAGRTYREGGRHYDQFTAYLAAASHALVCSPHLFYLFLRSVLLNSIFL